MKFIIYLIMFCASCSVHAQLVSKKCKTCGKVLSNCSFRGQHPAPSKRPSNKVRPNNSHNIPNLVGEEPVDKMPRLQDEAFEKDPVDPVQEEENEVFNVVEQMPEFPGGYDALNAYLIKNITYPAFALKNNIQGRVLIEFVVNKDGSVVDAKVVKSVDASVDKEALRVVSTMPRWMPGKQHGKPVRCKYTVPVMFRINNTDDSKSK